MTQFYIFHTLLEKISFSELVCKQPKYFKFIKNPHVWAAQNQILVNSKIFFTLHWKNLDVFYGSKEIFLECSVHFLRGPWPRQVTYIAQKMMFFAPRSSPISPVSPLGGARLLQLRLHCLGCGPGSFLHSLVNWNNSSYSFDSGSHLACYEYQLK